METPGKLEKQGRLYYGWIVVAACSMIILIDYGFGYNVLTVFNIPVCDTTGITRRQYSTMYTMAVLGQIFGSFSADRIIKKIGVMNTIRAGCILSIANTFFSAFVKNAPMLWLMGFLYGPTYVACGFFCLSIVIANWFNEKRGLATGIVFMSSGLGSVFLLPLSSRWIENFGWEKARFLFGVISLILLPIALILLKEKPADKGLEPYGGAAASAKSLSADDNWGYERKQVCRMGGAWLFALFVLGLNIYSATGSTIVPYLCDEGYSSAFASRIQSLNMFTTALSRVSAGYFCDRFSVEKTSRVYILTSPLLLAGALLISAGAGIFGVVIMATGYGFMMSIGSVFMTMLVGKLFGRKHFSEVYGLFSGLGCAAGTVSPLIYGKIYADSGSYVPVYILYSVILVIGISAYFAAGKVMAKKSLKQQ